MSERGFSVQQTFDSGYIVAGAYYPLQRPKLYLIKITPSGDTLWTRRYNIGGPGFFVQQTSDSGYIVAAGSSLVKIDSSDPDSIICKGYPGSLFCVQQTYDGGYVAVGRTDGLLGPRDVVVIKTDSALETLWTRSYTYGENPFNEGESVQQTPDRGFVIAGYTGSFLSGSRDVYLIKTDSIGDTLWTRTYGGTGSDVGYSVQQTTDGGYIVGGYTTSFGSAEQVYLIKIDSAGVVFWDSTYGWSTLESAYSLQQTYDSGYIVCGYTNFLDVNEIDLYLLRTDSGGHTIWSRIFGGQWEEVGYSVQQTLDSGYIVVGRSDSYYSGERRDSDVYLIKVASYQRGDANRDGLVDIADCVYLINYLFVGGPAPDPLAAGDANYDGVVNIVDVVYLLNYLFLGGPPPGC